MALVVTEQVRDQIVIVTNDSTEASKSFVVEGATDPIEAINAPTIPVYNDRYTYDSQPSGTLSNLRALNINCENMDNRDDLHLVTVKYTNSPRDFEPAAPADGDEIWTFQPTGEVVNVGDGFSQVKFGADAKDFDVIIGVNDDEDTIEGVDIPDTSEILIVDYWINAQLVDDTFLSDVRSEKNHINSGVYYGSAIGECRFDGMTVVKHGSDITQLQFTFTISRNLTASELPTYKNEDGTSYTIVGGKKGWQYLWRQNKTRVDGGSSLPYTKGVYLADVFKSSSFAKLPLSGLLRPSGTWPPSWA